MSNLPTVTVIIPCRNEQRFIGSCLDSILSGDYPPELLEIIVADGMSDDGTREVLQTFANRYTGAPSVRTIDNPHKIVSTGLNRAIEQARGEIIVRMDAHTEYATDYIRRCVEVLQVTGADNVGGAHRTRAHGYLQEAITLAFHSPFAVGGARSHNIDYEGPIDSVIYGCWRKKTLMKIGMFDEELVRNQDDELNLRINRGGGVVYQSKQILSWYQPRASLRALFRQYKQYGYWKVRVIQKHCVPASWRHPLPGAWVLSLLVLSLLSFFLAPARVILSLNLALYFIAALIASLITCRQPSRFKFILILPLIFSIYHFGYGYGFLRGLIDFVLLRRSARANFTRISR